MRNSNGTRSYYFSGTSSIIGNYFQIRSANYGRYLKEQKPVNTPTTKTSKNRQEK